MSFNGKEGTPVSLKQARQWTKAYQQNNEGKLHAIFFGKDYLNQLLAEEGAMGIRIYYGEDGEESKLVLVAADKEENNLLPSNEDTVEDGDDMILNGGKKCPPYCSGGNNGL